MESEKIADIVRGGILLAIAVAMAVLLYKYYSIPVFREIGFSSVPIFPIALVAAICWLTFRGIRAVVSALRDNE